MDMDNKMQSYSKEDIKQHKFKFKFKFIYYQNMYKFIIKYRCTMKWWADIVKCICP